ncbi:MAG: TrmH family RNA methyltransferase [Pseudomonadota bacterium]
MRINKETNEIQRVVALRNSRNKRHRYREFIVEGTTALEQAVEQGWSLCSLFYLDRHKLSDWAKGYLQESSCLDRYEVSDDIMDKIADREDRPEIIGVAQLNKHDFQTMEIGHPQVIMVLDEPKSPGNVGMLIRSAAAFGVSATVISGHAADEYDPKCIRSSAGTFFSMPVYHVDGFKKFSEKVDSLKQSNTIQVITTGDRGDVSITDAKPKDTT